MKCSKIWGEIQRYQLSEDRVEKSKDWVEMWRGYTGAKLAMCDAQLYSATGLGGGTELVLPDLRS